MEIFRRDNVRFIAVNNGTDSAEPGMLEFAPFINNISEWYALRMSRVFSYFFIVCFRKIFCWWKRLIIFLACIPNGIRQFPIDEHCKINMQPQQRNGCHGGDGIVHQ